MVQPVQTLDSFRLRQWTKHCINKKFSAKWEETIIPSCVCYASMTILTVTLYIYNNYCNGRIKNKW